MIETIKQAEDGSDTVVRLYEFENTQSQVELTLARTAKRIWIGNLMEEKQTLVAAETDRCSLVVKPFEIVTIMIEF